VLPAEDRAALFPPCLSSLVRISKAFPPLAEDTAALLIQYSKILTSESAAEGGYASPKDCGSIASVIDIWGKPIVTRKYTHVHK